MQREGPPGGHGGGGEEGGGEEPEGEPWGEGGSGGGVTYGGEGCAGSGGGEGGPPAPPQTWALMVALGMVERDMLLVIQGQVVAWPMVMRPLGLAVWMLFKTCGIMKRFPV